MLEILVFISALGGLGARIQQRGLSKSKYIAIAATGWLFFLTLGLLYLGPIALPLRWGWILVIYAFIEMTHSGAKVSEETWRCPDCQLFNESRTLVCLCGYKHPEAPSSVGT